jgi:hypothetical protein
MKQMNMACNNKLTGGKRKKETKKTLEIAILMSVQALNILIREAYRPQVSLTNAT